MYRRGTCPLSLDLSYFIQERGHVQRVHVPLFVFWGSICYDFSITAMSEPEPTTPQPTPPEPANASERKFKVKIPSLKLKIKKFKRGTVIRAFLIAVLAGLAVGLGGILGSYVAIRDNLPDVSDIETFKPKLITI